MSREVNPRKAAVIGCGFVGSATAFTLMQSRLFSELKFWQSTGGTIVAIRRGQTVILSPGPYAELYSGDVIILVGSPSAAEAAHRLVTTKE